MGACASLERENDHLNLENVFSSPILTKKKNLNFLLCFRSSHVTTVLDYPRSMNFEKKGKEREREMWKMESIL